MTRIVHTADVHFDTPFSARFDERQARLRRNEIKNTFSSIIRLAAEADLLLIAGDLFDAAYVREETLAFVRHKFDEIPQTEIFLAAGNHDPLSAGFYAALEDAHVHIFSDTLSYVDLAEKEVRVHGVSFAQKDAKGLLDQPLELHPSWCNLLVVHGDCTAGAQVYHPISLKKLAELGVDYAALGHIHRFSGIQRAGGVFYAYPGVPEGRGFDECGDCGVIAGEVARGVADLRFVPIAGRHFFQLEVPCTQAMGVQEIAEKIAEMALSLGGKEDFYRILLTGTRTPELKNINLWLAEIKDLLLHVQKRFTYLELEDHTRAEIPAELIRSHPLLRAYSECFDHPPKGEEALYALAREIGLQALMEKKND